MKRYDVVVIGGGAAGLSAALVLSRARRKVLVVDAGAPRNAPASHMHGYLSRDGRPPAEPDGRGGFWVLLDGRQRLSARRLLATTGLRDELPEVPGLRDRWARDVLHCPYCPGHEVRDRRLGVIGGSPGSVRYAQVVRQWTHDLVCFTPGDTLTDTERTELQARAIGVVEGTIDQLVIDDADHLRGVRMADGCVVPRDALFVPPRFVPHSTLLVGLGCRHRPRRRPRRRRRAQRRTRLRARPLAHTCHARPPQGVIMTDPAPMSDPSSGPAVGPPTKHQLAVMIWVAVFPTLTVLNLALGGWLGTLSPVVRTFVLATIAVPIVIYGLMPQLHRLRGHLLTRLASS